MISRAWRVVAVVRALHAADLVREHALHDLAVEAPLAAIDRRAAPRAQRGSEAVRRVALLTAAARRAGSGWGRSVPCARHRDSAAGNGRPLRYVRIVASTRAKARLIGTWCSDIIFISVAGSFSSFALPSTYAQRLAHNSLWRRPFVKMMASNASRLTDGGSAATARPDRDSATASRRNDFVFAFVTVVVSAPSTALSAGLALSSVARPLARAWLMTRSIHARTFVPLS